MNRKQINDIINRQIHNELIEKEWFSYGRFIDGKVIYTTRKDFTFEDLFVRAFHAFASDIGICGCGTPYDTYKEIMDFLEFCNNADGYTEEHDKSRKEFFEQPYAQFMAYVLDSKGYVNHGSSIRHCFIEQKGEDFLAMLKEEFNQGIVSDIFGECF